VLDQPAQFGMIMWKAESEEDGILFQLDAPISVEV
jgi:ureidoglycolate lyase